jgi:hypothetical protein
VKARRNWLVHKARPVDAQGNERPENWYDTLMLNYSGM